ncbi:hypothetical protein [Rhodococcus ruber]|uniref:hypothetical protein n=1 Tax=Rhodococcus ruber TaxID=1830 RepID=UPI001F359D6B|nr:hypothetical protein [Rhodococcus ruber]MCF8783175.1 hypothetical protein [Rhodococcus ruber]
MPRDDSSGKELSQIERMAYEMAFNREVQRPDIRRRAIRRQVNLTEDRAIFTEEIVEEYWEGN